MAFILPGIFSLIQHPDTLRKAPESYRPERCPQPACRLSAFGATVATPGSLIARTLAYRVLTPFPYCASIAPSAVAPTRSCRSAFRHAVGIWWEVRQVIFLLLLAGKSIGPSSGP